jgi:hypothetical protein
MSFQSVSVHAPEHPLAEVAVISERARRDEPQRISVREDSERGRKPERAVRSAGVRSANDGLERALQSKWRVAFVLVATVAAVGCGQASGESSRAQPAPSAAGQPASASASPGARAVARIVFIDQEQACECTRNRIDGSWTALQAALGEGSGVAVERIHRDTQEEQAEEYRMLRPLVTVPGIYLLDENGAILELLQGEVTEAQLRAALGRRG